MTYVEAHMNLMQIYVHQDRRNPVLAMLVLQYYLASCANAVSIAWDQHRDQDHDPMIPSGVIFAQVNASAQGF